MWTIALQHDYFGPNDSSAPVWAKLLAEKGHVVRWVDVTRPDILEQLRGCHGFMWRFAHFGYQLNLARRLLPVVEEQLGLVTYPDRGTAWHFNDKIAQYYLLNALGIPTPKTWVWFDQQKALHWAKTAAYPLVLKLAGGASSTNVRLIESADEAIRWINRLFGPGTFDLSGQDFPKLSWSKRIRWAVRSVIEGLPPLRRHDYAPLEGGYVLFQEFLPNNDHDTRITVIGNRAFGFRRRNRPNDFRASGSGQIDHDPSLISPAQVQFAFRVAERLGMQSCAMDLLWRGEEIVVCEISYSFASWAVAACPGHWVREPSGRISWQQGNMQPEEAILEDFLRRIEDRFGMVASERREQRRSA